MDKPSEDEKWQALIRAQIMSATTNKFMVIMQLVDQKAQVMILLNSALVPMCLNALEHGSFTKAAIISIVTAVLSILSAIVCIYPKRKYRKRGDRGLNLLHFNDIGHMEENEYMALFKPVYNDQSLLAQAVMHDLHDTSRYSIRPKFFWLKITYGTFAAGNIIALIVVLLEIYKNAAVVLP